MVAPELDSSSGVPLYRQIADILRAEISSGSADESEPMTEAKLIARFGVSLAPIRQALSELSREGFVYRKQGRGTFPVRGVRVDRPADLKTGDLYQFLVERGLHPKSTVEHIERVVPPASIQSRLASDSGEQLLHFARRITVDDQPFAVNDIYIRAPKGFEPNELELNDGGSALTLLEQQYGISIDRAEHEAWATAANAGQSIALGVEEGSPVLVIDTVFYATGGVPIGWRTAVHRPDEFKYHFTSDR